MDLDRFSQPMSWEYKRKQHDTDELEEYKRRRDDELAEETERNDKDDLGRGQE